MSARSERQAHDEFFKRQLSNKTMAQDFFRQFLPTDLVEGLDLEHIENDTTTYITRHLRQLYSDLVWICPFQAAGKPPIRVAILLEHKSSMEPFPHFQLLRYMVEIWDINSRKKAPFLPILPIVFYHGEGRWEKR